MKLINKILIAVMSVGAITSCVDKDPDYQVFPSADVDFTYNVDGDQYVLDYYVVSTVQFNNTSSKTGPIHWDFGDGTTSTEANPLHKYDKAGVYRVTLTIDGVGSKTYPVLIYDIVPVLSVDSQSTDIVEFNNTEMTFSLELPNPENLKVKYVWSFPEGTIDVATGQPVTEFVGYAHEDGSVDYPAAVKFSNIGSQRIEISSWFDLDGENRRLDDTYLNVQVGVSTPAPTIYYAERGGNIKAMKLVDSSTLPAGTKILPYDMGVASGNNVFNICYAPVTVKDEEGNNIEEDWIYILDAGKQYYYINDEDGILGDGMINAMRCDGTGVNTVITNVGGAAFNDPFQGFVYQDYLYYSDRNTGVSRVALTTRGAVQEQNSAHNRDEYVWQNTTIPYYNRGIAYGAIHTAMERDSKGMWWWAKNYSGNGIYRFKDGDIYKTQAEAEKVKSPYPIVMPGIKPRAMAIDESRQALYLYLLGSDEGFYAFPLPDVNDPGDSKKYDAKISLTAKAENTTSDEGIHVCQLALDKESGRVFFCFRPDGDKTLPAGVSYYDPSTKKVYHYGDANDNATAICINPRKTKLF